MDHSQLLWLWFFFFFYLLLFLKQFHSLQNQQTLLIYFPLWPSWWRICLQCRRPGFDPWVGNVPWRRERLPTPVFWPGEFHGLYSPWGSKESYRLSDFHFTSWIIFTVSKVSKLLIYLLFLTKIDFWTLLAPRWLTLEKKSQNYLSLM